MLHRVDVDVWCPDVVVVVMCMCVEGVLLLGGGGGRGVSRDAFSFNKHGWPESEIVV